MSKKKNLSKILNLMHQAKRTILAPEICTMSHCPEDGCDNTAVGSFLCLDCIRKSAIEVCGEKLPLFEKYLSIMFAAKENILRENAAIREIEEAMSEKAR